MIIIIRQWFNKDLLNKLRCIKSVRIRRFSGLYFRAYRLNTDQKNSENGHFSRSVVPGAVSSVIGRSYICGPYLRGNTYSYIPFWLDSSLHWRLIKLYGSYMKWNLIQSLNKKYNRGIFRTLTYIYDGANGVFRKINDEWKPSTLFAKSSIADV